ncbi:uncharacterized protein LOC109010822 [Juglans regia]|uniref:Uncharacterized protein LOC109010822 n=1 Tax=Juglans regia TaxID=51240 RepID=A0A6P9EGT8_JUGRE|nr:uncharacterized protein LOC109010822 [Juglans regia]
MDKSWMTEPNRLRSPAYAAGVNNFLEMAQNHARGSDRIRCPCRICSNNLFLPLFTVESHLFINGIDLNYTEWIFHGEEETRNFDVDDEEVAVSDEDEFIDDMDNMLDDILAGTNVDVPESSTPLPSRDSFPEALPVSSFDELLEDTRRPLFGGCTKFSKLSFIVKLLHIKTLGGWSIKSFDMLLNLLKSAFPDAELPLSYEDARSLERGLGFKYNKIHACPNDYILYWKEYSELNSCPICKASRWMSTTNGNRMIPHKVLWHFPLKPRLQRLFLSTKIAAEMRWHKEKRLTDENFLRHPSDSKSWKAFDEAHSWFANDPCNVRLGLASDGFNPFNNMAKPYSIWPVILVPYNLPSWLCMKDQFFMTSLIIPGPKSPGNDIDVYLQPLLDELLELWEHGVPTYDSSTKETFMLDATLLWTINDFPAYGNLSGWSTKGKFACPCCNENTDSNWLKYGRKHCYMGHRRFLPQNHIWRKKKLLFNGNEDHRIPPMLLGGADILSQLQMLGDVPFGKSIRKRKWTAVELNWTKHIIFFKLPYWSTLLLRHNLDAMHIEKNICDNIFGTLLNIPGKTKDNINSRRDLELLGLRNELHLKVEGQKITMPHALYTLHGDERKTFCSWMTNVKFPDGFASNISRCVSVHDCKISGLKSHDCHVFLQRLLPIAVGGYLRSDIALALTELSTFFKELCARTLDINRLSQLETDVVSILEHYAKCQVNNQNSIDRTHQHEFPAWFKKRVQDQRASNPLGVSADLYVLACGPDNWVGSYAACIINGKRFHTKQCELRRRTQNSGVVVTGDQQSNNVDFYGVINDVVELHYMGGRRVYLFSCDWFDVGDKKWGV